LPSGPPTASAANLLYSGRLIELIERCRLEFDAVLIDTPPMLQMPDARVVGRLADAVIMVIRSGKTTRGEAMAAYRRFADDGTRVLGTILNAWDPKKSDSGYSYKAYSYKYLPKPE
jgi:polysaccharide biosynthesis transport protein